VLRHEALETNKLRPGALSAHPRGLTYQDRAGKITHPGTLHGEQDSGKPPDVRTAVRAMDALGIDIQVIFPQQLLEIGLHPQPDIEVALTEAYSKWLVEQILPTEPRIKTLLQLPLVDPDACLRLVERYADHPAVVGFMVSSQRHQGIHHHTYMRLYHRLEEIGKPIGFHAAPSRNESWTRAMNKFIALHSITFVTCNMVHMANWVFNGLPERFPGLKPIWIESGLAWVPFLMQRLDHEYLMRRSDAPLLRRLPSEYMREMYYSSQPMERHNAEALEFTFKMINARDTLLYSSDWPHWDFDTPGTIAGIPFLDDAARRNILGENARRLFRLEQPGPGLTG
jgi:predicted TIM-barrel fold metal-dependent hydrolase